MKPLNYLRVLASVVIAVWRFGWWCLGKALQPGLTWEADGER
jgi:hypothetical protein